MKILIFIKILIISVDASNYLIQSVTDTIYFEYNITKLDEYSLMKPLTINMSLSSTRGIILYCLDNDKNQFILSVNDSDMPTIYTEFNGKTKTTSLSKFCNCVKCTNEPLIFNISMNGKFIIECNGAKVEMSNENPKIINYEYPVFEITMPYKARLWLVNTPQYANSYPSNNQLSGCIYDILYDGEPINIKRYGKLPDANCISQCHKTFCNRGNCVENYGMHPTCDCSNTFENGKYCNSSVKVGNRTKRIYQNATFMFKKTRLSWNGTSNNIFIATNEFFSIRIYSFQTFLKLEFEDRTNNFIKVTATLMGNYTYNSENNLIIWFEDQFIIVNMPKNSSKNISIPINRNLENEIFQTIQLQGPTVYVLRFIYSNGYKWNDINALQYIDIPIPDSVTPTKNPINISKWSQQSMDPEILKYSLSILLVVVVGVIELIFIIKIVIGNSKSKHETRMKDSVSVELISGDKNKNKNTSD